MRTIRSFWSETRRAGPSVIPGTAGVEVGRQAAVEPANVPHAEHGDFLSLVLVEAQRFVARPFRDGDCLCPSGGGLRVVGEPVFIHSGQSAKKEAVANVSGILRNAEDEKVFCFSGIRLHCDARVLRQEIA